MRKAASARGQITPERAEVMAQIEKMLGLEPGAAPDRKPGEGKTAPQEHTARAKSA